MEWMIDTEAILRAASVLTALGGIGGVVVWCVKFVARQNRQDRELAALRAENCLLCYGLSACLDGLEQLGANHTVPAAREKLDKHLNQAAHRGESLD